MTLHQLPIGQSAIITKVGGEGEQRYRFLGYGTDSQNKSDGDKSGSHG